MLDAAILDPYDPPLATNSKQHETMKTPDGSPANRIESLRYLR